MRRFLIVLALVVPFVASRASAEVIAPADVLALRVTDWLPVDGELREWTAMNGTYTVGADGTVSFPYVGEVMVAGLSPVAAGELVGEELRQRLALADQPFANVSIASRRPILVGGAVHRPGEIPYAAGMTARHAIAQAGGVTGLAGDGAAVIVQMLTAAAQIRILSHQEIAAAVRVARLRAELNGSSTLEPLVLPDGAADDSGLADRKADANRLLGLQREKMARETELVDGRINLLSEEIVSLQAKQAALERQKALAAESRGTIADLADRGLAANVRLLDAEQTLLTVETQVLDVATALLRARQLLQVARSDRLQLVEGRKAEIMLDLEKSEAELAEVRERLALQNALTRLLSAGIQSGDENNAVRISIYHAAGGNVATAPDNLDSVLQPGDLIEVTLPLTLPTGDTQ